MYKLLLIATVLFQAHCAAQENLVINPSFEDTASMGIGWPYLITAGWWNPNGSTADYYSPFCSELCCGSGLSNCAPYTEYLGFQFAQDGDSYLGLDIYESTGPTKEYAQGFLTSPLAAGHTYCVSVWISILDSSSLKSCDFQVAFTSELFYDSENGGSLNFENYVYYDISNADTSNWLMLQGIYIAQGGEQFIYLGSNTANDEITCVEQFNETWLWNSAYILVDNVSVVESSECINSLLIYNSLNKPVVYPNPTQEYLKITKLPFEPCTILFIDAIGRVIKCMKHGGGDVLLDLRAVSPGPYLMQIQSAETNLVYWILIE